MGEKQKYGRASYDIELEGYTNDMVLPKNLTVDWTERLYVLQQIKTDSRGTLQVYNKVLKLIDGRFLRQYGDDRPMDRPLPFSYKIRSWTSILYLQSCDKLGEIGPVEELIDDKRPKLYKTVQD
ncbi:hypothetical protein R3W88_027022 [Solanum pinnatisectum]|uniref:Uncharacterized protein n=1 Tax=Solanum pinnatisectum TaxID=50273 RepID=A0AAV9LG43_9SOLN|nr:hypothetical protein R3W88_027022 [Solanum pinnatisectum]